MELYIKQMPQGGRDLYWQETILTGHIRMQCNYKKELMNPYSALHFEVHIYPHVKKTEGYLVTHNLNSKEIDNIIKIANNLELGSIDNKFRIKDEKMNVNEPRSNKNS
jgi:hypothetical protein